MSDLKTPAKAQSLEIAFEELTTVEALEILRRVAFKVWPQTFESILSKEQIEYMMDMMYAPSVLDRSLPPGCILKLSLPRPPICIKSNITIFPNMLHVDTVGSVTSPVTQVEVVAVKSASRYGTASLLAELIGKAKSPLPTRMVTRKLSNMI